MKLTKFICISTLSAITFLSCKNSNKNDVNNTNDTNFDFEKIEVNLNSYHSVVNSNTFSSVNVNSTSNIEIQEILGKIKCTGEATERDFTINNTKANIYAIKNVECDIKFTRIRFNNFVFSSNIKTKLKVNRELEKNSDSITNTKDNNDVRTLTVSKNQKIEFLIESFKTTINPNVENVNNIVINNPIQNIYPINALNPNSPAPISDLFSIKLGQTNYVDAKIKRNVQITIDSITRKINRTVTSYDFIIDNFTFENEQKNYKPTFYVLHNQNNLNTNNIVKIPIDKKTQILPEHTKITFFDNVSETFTFPLYEGATSQNGTYVSYNDLISRMQPIVLEEVATVASLTYLLSIPDLPNQTKQDILTLINFIN
jgi:hypothetical protein